MRFAMNSTSKLTIATVVACSIMLAQREGTAQRASRLQVNATSIDALRTWDTYVTQRARTGRLRVRAVDRDPALPGRLVERLEQVHEGVRIWGAEIVRDSDRGVPQGIFGQLSADLALNVQPALGGDGAELRLLQAGGGKAMLLKPVELVIVPLDSGEPRLAYTSVVSGSEGVNRVFIDANTGLELLKFSDVQTQAAVGRGGAYLGDTKKLSVIGEAGMFTADDQHRPPVLRTYDMRGNLRGPIAVVNGGGLFPSDRATDSDNEWTDVAAVDTHAHIGWTYDYYFKRHGRRGLDNRDRPIIALINGLTQQGALSAPASAVDYVLNAFWCGACGPGGDRASCISGTVSHRAASVPARDRIRDISQVRSTSSRTNDPRSHGLLVAPHLSQRVGRAERSVRGHDGDRHRVLLSAARQRMGQADYLIGEDTVRGVTTSLNGIRSMSDPAAFGDPDHYSQRYGGNDDNGGVHINSGIANHAFYLAIEGGTNRTSGLAVQGVGAANREQIEKVFYRAFVFLLPSSATFSTARAATIQSARDLYGAGSAAGTRGHPGMDGGRCSLRGRS